MFVPPIRSPKRVCRAYRSLARINAGIGTPPGPLLKKVTVAPTPRSGRLCLARHESDLIRHGKAPALAKGCRRPHRASVLSGERLDDRLGDRVGVLVEREVAAVEIAHLGLRHILLHEFRSRRHEERVISPPDDERPRLPV